MQASIKLMRSQLDTIMKSLKKPDEITEVKPENISAVQRAIGEMKLVREQICLLKNKSKGTFTDKLQILR